MNVRPRSYGYYVFAAVLMTLVVGWVGRYTWQELQYLYRGFAIVQADG